MINRTLVDYQICENMVFKLEHNEEGEGYPMHIDMLPEERYRLLYCSTDCSMFVNTMQTLADCRFLESMEYDPKDGYIFCMQYMDAEKKV